MKLSKIPQLGDGTEKISKFLIRRSSPNPWIANESIGVDWILQRSVYLAPNGGGSGS